MEGAAFIEVIDALARETTLFACVWFVVGGLDDLAVDLLFFLRLARRWWRGTSRQRAIASPMPAGRIVVFIAAWDESAVIGSMLRTALDRFEHPDYRLYVGTYPNDPATIEAVAAVADADARVRLVVGPNPGPTTKADCLNALWRALLGDEAAEGVTVTAIVLHDAEDLVHRLELQVFARHLPRHAAVQLPVHPLAQRGSPLVSGHYCDEFVEAHTKTLLVRQAIGAALPLAGVGCAIRRDMIGQIAALRGGAPFDATSLTEDYELGLTIRALGGRTLLARVPEAPGGPAVAVRGYFPATVRAAVRQKARWMTGIALAGWDRTGWGRALDLGDHWMRMRDRRAILAMPVLLTAYAALLFWGGSWGAHLLAATAMPALAPGMALLLAANLALLGWRIVLRALFVGRAYGWRDGVLLSFPRMLVANYIALLAARRAAVLYVRLLAGGKLHWEKTDHQFPDAQAQAA